MRDLSGEIFGDRIGVPVPAWWGSVQARLARSAMRRSRPRGDRAGRKPAARQHPIKPAREPEHHQRIDHQQRERAEEQRPAQILRLAEPIGFHARGERRVIDRVEPVGRA